MPKNVGPTNGPHTQPAVRKRVRPTRASLAPKEKPNAVESTGYKVGYKKPPENTRFRKGQSGNPEGRPKKARGLLPQLREELASTITIREGGKETTITRFQAVIKRLVSDTMNGKPAQMRLMLDMMRVMEKAGEEIHLERELSRADAELLREMIGGLSYE